MKILDYRLYLYNHKQGEFEWISMEQGQRLIMILSQPNPPKFVLIDNNLINASNISKIEEQPENDGIWTIKDRELTESEEKTQKLFDQFRSSKNLMLK